MPTPRTPTGVSTRHRQASQTGPELDDIYGQEHAKRALIVVAAGPTRYFITSPPGAGKTMLARVLVSLLPALEPEEQSNAYEAMKLYSLAGEPTEERVTHHPFRSPHYTPSRVSSVGGGANPRPRRYKSSAPQCTVSRRITRVFTL